MRPSSVHPPWNRPRLHGSAKRGQKRALILLELLIALSLISILLIFLFSFFVENAKIEKKLITARTAIMNRSHLQVRLQGIFTSIDQASMQPFFYTKQASGEKNISLIALFDNGIDPEPLFSGSVLGRIHLDPKQNLCLTTSPVTKEKDPPSRTEILFSNVKRFEFEFLGQKKASEHGEKEKTRSINANLAWKSSWSKKERVVPGIIRLVLTENTDNQLQFAFILPVTEPRPIYLERTG